ncbi:MAG: O-antigen ligase domain-containing protein [Pseudomonadota bacterium]
MDQIAAYPRAPEDYLVSVALLLTWPVYLIGGLYVLGPVLAVSLTALVFSRALFSGVGHGIYPLNPIPIGLWVWIAGMGAMLIALEIAHIGHQLGAGQTLKSTIGWAKGWALFIMFPLAGACLSIRIETLIRAAGYLSLMTLCLIPVFLVAPTIGLPETLYVSPLKYVGGPGPEFFSVSLYSLEPTDGSARFRFFTPWSPAAGFIGNMYLIFALSDRRLKWKILGVVSAVLVIWFSKSRLGLAAAMVIWPTVMLVSRANRPILYFAGTAGALVSVPFLEIALRKVDETLSAVKSMRADSTRVREALGEIAVERWWTEAPVWGHGVVERGPHFVEFMPIGSHHTWYGLLFVKGAVGALALVIPLAWSLIDCALAAVTRLEGKIGLGMVLLMIIYSVGENLEILTYLMWPGLIAMGMALRHRTPCQETVRTAT